MGSKLFKGMEPAPHIDPQHLIVGMLAVKYLQQHGQPVILQHKEMEELAKFTIRLEIVNPEDPLNSPIKCQVITVTDAIKFMEEMQRSRGK